MLRHGGQNEWKYAWDISEDSSISRAEMKKLLKAMSCTTNEQHIQQLLSRLFYPDVKQLPSETMAVIQRLANNPSARKLALNFVLDNWTFLKTQYEKKTTIFLLIMFFHCLVYLISPQFPQSG